MLNMLMLLLFFLTHCLGKVRTETQQIFVNHKCQSFDNKAWHDVSTFAERHYRVRVK